MTTIGVLHPGEMGSAVGAAAHAAGGTVLWASEGRSPATRRRALDDGLHDVTTVERLVTESCVILSICPPAAAIDVAHDVSVHGFTGIYVDANAVSPETSRDVGATVRAGGATYVDGGIVGPPPRQPGFCRLYLAGPAADDVAALFAGSPLEPIVLDGPIGAASALKMAYAGWNKGWQALVLAVRALAAREGVDAALLAEWARSMPEMPARSEQAAAANVRKAWRFVGEMEEIAATFRAAGLPSGFHEAATEVYRRLAPWRGTPATPSIDEVLNVLTP